MINRIVFIESGLGNTNNIKRMEEFAANGYDITVYAFDRGDNAKNAPKGMLVHIVGELSSDSSYISRIGILLRGVQKVLDFHRDEECIFYLFRNDIAQVFTSLSRRPYIFEEADMTHLNLNNRLLRYLMEWNVKRIIKNSILSVFRSEGFLLYHFGSKRPDNVYVIPNRLHPDVMDLPEVKKKELNNNCISFGFVGVIRYDTILSFTNTVLSHFPQHEFHFFGNYPSKKMENRFEQLKQYSNCHFHGVFKSPEDLPDIYSKIDVLLSTYDVSAINPRYAEPNKLYEAIYFDTPIIVSSNSFLSDKVRNLGIGYDVDARNEDSVISLVERITPDDIILKRERISSIDKKTCINKNDAFFEKLKKKCCN